jgi:hypothetical protein
VAEIETGRRRLDVIELCQLALILDFRPSELVEQVMQELDGG